jgi:hypothetical protein
MEINNYVFGFGGKRKVTFSGFRGGHIGHSKWHLVSNIRSAFKLCL